MSFIIKQAKKYHSPGLPLLFFIDSLHFLNGSLDNLGENVFHYLSQEFEYINSVKLDPSHLYTPGRGFYKHFLLLLFGGKSSIYT